MDNELELPVRIPPETLKSQIETAASQSRTQDLRLTVKQVKLRSGETALSVRMEKAYAGGEIFKIVPQPLEGPWFMLVVPQNRTGGASAPELDPSGEAFWSFFRRLWHQFHKLGFVSVAPDQALVPELVANQFRKYRDWKTSNG